MFPTDTPDPTAAMDEGDDRTQLRSRGEQGSGEAGSVLAPNVLKSRFVLEDQLGSGGMGTVYRAKDLRKVEAQDKAPYLAIKVLNGDFREHPDAFIALQREAAKSQSLSHRNIVKIFDFDKDGDVPFMTMELLRGNELAELLREYPQGLPESLAWPVIRGFCSALKHAHAEGVIHADLKPGNLFVTHAGQVKIFDFGLARAVHANFAEGVLQTRTDVEDLIFDAAALGALTPAFASRAMLQGQSPQAADDVFAAAIVIYQILTGKHPYNRIPADKVDPRSAPLERPRQLSSRQWRALSSALALEESERLSSVAALQSALFDRSPWPMRLLAAGLGVIAITLWVFNLQKEDEIRVVQQQAQQAGRVEAGVDRILELIQKPTFDALWEQRVSDELARLRTMPESQRVLGNATAQIASLYVQESMEHPTVSVAMELATRGAKFGNMAAAWESISQRVLRRLNDHLDSQPMDETWVGTTEALYSQLKEVSRDRHLAALVAQDVNSAYVVGLREASTGLPDTVAQEALDVLKTREFDRDVVDELIATRSAVAASVVQEIERDQAQLDVLAFGQDFRNKGCPVGELEALQRSHSQMRGTNLVDRDLLARRTDRVLAECVMQLAVSEPDTAASLRRDALALFGSLPRTQAVRLDPCDRQYLVNAGQQRGRAGTCSDTGESRPTMVVVGTPSGAIAVARYETSRAEVSLFCTETGVEGCPDDSSDLPLTGVDIAFVRAYSSWLSESTGFSYRLPTLKEWQFAAQHGDDDLDPNRNCKVNVGGVSRGGRPEAVDVGAPGALGLVNALGNVAEWVEDSGNLRTIGGHYNDEIGDCVSENLALSNGQSSVVQGFRLVRELSPITRDSGL